MYQSGCDLAHLEPKRTYSMHKILVIEDEQDMREALLTKLTADGYFVRTAESAELGLKTVIEEKPDVILLDVMTHSMHGSAFIKRLRELPEGQNDSKVIVLTNLDSELSRKKLMESGALAYLIKSQVSLETISATVKKVLAVH
jgi:DNA-binding response OmpR family regulator